MKARDFPGSTHVLSGLILLLLMDAILISGCVYRPDFSFPVTYPAGDDFFAKTDNAMAKAVIPDLPYSMTWSVDPNQQNLVIELDAKRGAIPFWHISKFWKVVRGGQVGASPFFDKAAQWRFTLLAPDNKTICGDGKWSEPSSNSVTCDLSKIKPYYGQGLSAHIDYVYDKPTGEPFPFLSMARTFYIVERDDAKYGSGY